MTRTELNICILAALLCFPAAVFPQMTVRTDDGIVDLLDERDVDEDLPYQNQLDVFQLKGESRPSRSRGRLLSLGLKGEPVVVEETNPGRAELIKRYIGEREWRKALGEINDGLALNPNDFELLRLAAFVNTVLGDFYMADYYYRRYMEFNPEDITILTNWAGIMLRTYRFEEADKQLERALEIDPYHVPAKFYKTIIAIAKGEVQANAEEWMRARLGDKRNVVNWISEDIENYKNILGPTGLERMCDIIIGEDSYEPLADIRAEMNKFYALAGNEYDKRLAALDRLSALGVAGLAIPLERAVIEFRQGNAEQALKTMSELNTRFPNDPILLTHYGYMLLRHGEYTRAESLLRQSLSLREVPDAKLSLASSLIMLQRMDEAWDLIWEMAAESPRQVMVWLQGDDPYIMRLIKDSKYPALCNRLGIPPESR